MPTFDYSSSYSCDNTLYRHVVYKGGSWEPTPLAIENKALLDEDTWRRMGICQSLGWEHIGYSHCDERNPVLLFKKESKGEFTDPLLPSH